MYQLNIRRRVSALKTEVRPGPQSTEIEYLKLLAGLEYTWYTKGNKLETDWRNGERAEIERV